jgi:hypothetical protein
MPDHLLRAALVEQARPLSRFWPWVLGSAVALGVAVLLRLFAWPALSSDFAILGGAEMPKMSGSVPPGPTGGANVAAVPNPEKIFFETGKYETPDSTSRKMSAILAFSKAHGNSRLTIIGYQDSAEKGEPALRLARQRSMAVRSVLISAGVTEDRILIKSERVPKETVGEREATKVEVSITP